MGKVELVKVTDEQRKEELLEAESNLYIRLWAREVIVDDKRVNPPKDRITRELLHKYIRILGILLFEYDPEEII